MVSRSRSSRASSISSFRSASSPLSRTWPMKMSWNNSLADPFPFSQTAIMRYSCNISLDPSSVVAVSHVFRANSIFDPDLSGTGHQPYGHDQYQAIYKYYRVKKAIITASSTNTGANNIMGVAIRASGTVITDPENIREIKGTRYTPLANDPASNRIQQTYNLSSTEDRHLSTASFGANPSNNQSFHVWAAPNGSSDPTSLSVAVDIVYIVEMFEPIILGTS